MGRTLTLTYDIGGWRRLCNNEIENLFQRPDIIKYINKNEDLCGHA